ncbi:MAG: hypothetical protein J6L75_05780 [Alistipes sp.]|nr:hypothetical protein [Alistipes sp.]
MKKLLLAIAAVLALASCAKDDTTVEAQQATLSFNVTSPAIATRYGEGTTATKLDWATYDEEEGLISGLCGEKTFSLNTNVELSLVQGRAYRVVFWAQAEGAPYERVWGQPGEDYTKAQINIVGMGDLTANEESYDAFFHCTDKIEVSGSDVLDVDLVRPFAQLNIATADIEKAKNADLEVARTGVEVTGVFSTLRLWNGSVENETTAKFALADKAEGTIKTNNNEYSYLAMNYLLVNAKDLVDVKLSLQDQESNVKVLTRSYSSVPVQRNYRTNIIGNILTSDMDFNIEVKPGFEEDGFGVIDGKIFQYVKSLADIEAALDNDEVEVIILTEDIDLDNQPSTVSTRAAAGSGITIPATRTVTLDLNGKSLKKATKQTSAYALITNNGNLTIIDSKQGGKISYTDTGNGGNYGSNTIQNNNTLTIEGGIFENLSATATVRQNGYPHVIDTNGSPTINGGTFDNQSDYSSVRIWCTDDDNTITTINGGTFNGCIDIHNVNVNANKSTTTITGGTFNGDNWSNCSVRLLGFGVDVDEIVCNIEGGEFMKAIKLRKYIEGEENFNANVFNITGGTFHDASVFNFLADGADIKLGSDMAVAENTTITIPAENTVTIDLNENTLSGESTTSGKNYNMFDVRGTLTVKNGTMEYKHTGENMAWNNFAELFYVGFNGTLNLDGVTAKNLGGSDMAYVVDMVNATDITVNVNNSTLKSTYIPVRVFNNNSTGVHNVAIENSTLEGKYCFWVQYWLADGRDEETLQNTVKLDIFNTEGEDSNNNTFIYNNNYNAPVLYGNEEFFPIDQYGNEISLYTEVAEGIKQANSDGNYVITAAAGLNYIRTNLDTNDGFAGKTITLESDIDLTEVADFTPIAAGTRSGSSASGTGFKGVFDGAGKIIEGLKITSGGANDAVGFFGVINGGEVKNVKFTDVAIEATSTKNVGTVAGLVVNGGKISGVTVESGSVKGLQGTGGIAGRILLHGTIENCTNNASVLSNSSYNIGGIVGAAYYTNAEGTMTIKNCTNNGSVEGHNGVGGIAGLSAADIEGCKNYGEVIGYNNSVGGIAGEQSYAGSVIGCYNYGKVTNNSGSATGGIIGWTRYNIQNESDYLRTEIIEISGNTNEGEIKGVNLVGGIAGQIFNYAILDGNTNKAPKITATNNTDIDNGKAAGIVGHAYCAENQGTIEAETSFNITLKNNTSTTTAENISGAVTKLIVNYNTNSEYIHLEGNTPAEN